MVDKIIYLTFINIYLFRTILKYVTHHVSKQISEIYSNSFYFHNASESCFSFLHTCICQIISLVSDQTFVFLRFAKMLEIFLKICALNTMTYAATILSQNQPSCQHIFPVIKRCNYNNAENLQKNSKEKQEIVVIFTFL